MAVGTGYSKENRRLLGLKCSPVETADGQAEREAFTIEIDDLVKAACSMDAGAFHVCKSLVLKCPLYVSAVFVHLWFATLWGVTDVP